MFNEWLERTIRLTFPICLTNFIYFLDSEAGNQGLGQRFQTIPACQRGRQMVAKAASEAARWPPRPPARPPGGCQGRQRGRQRAQFLLRPSPGKKTNLTRVAPGKKANTSECHPGKGTQTTQRMSPWPGHPLLTKNADVMIFRNAQDPGAAASGIFALRKVMMRPRQDFSPCDKSLRGRVRILAVNKS